MPFRTDGGDHYHMTYGCHGATKACGTEGLSPCPDCCDPDAVLLPPTEQRKVDSALCGYMRAAEAEFRRAFTHGVFEEIREWNTGRFIDWQRENPEKVGEIRARAREDARRMRCHGRLVTSHMASAVFGAYEKENPSPYPEVSARYERSHSVPSDLISEMPAFQEGMQAARDAAMSAWEAAGANQDSAVAQEMERRQRDSRLTWSERLGAERRHRGEAIAAAVIEGSQPVEHDGVMYEQVDATALVAACQDRHVNLTSCHKGEDGSVLVRPAVPGEWIVSRPEGDTEGFADVGEEGSLVLTRIDDDGNPLLDADGHPDEWQVNAEEAGRIYDLDELGEDMTGVAKARSVETKVIRVDRDVMLVAPRGDAGDDGGIQPVAQYVRRGGYIDVTDPGGVVAVSEEEFVAAYRRDDGVEQVPPLP